MTVKELIERLKGLPESTEVLTPDGLDITYIEHLEENTVYLCDDIPEDSE